MFSFLQLMARTKNRLIKNNNFFIFIFLKFTVGEHYSDTRQYYWSGAVAIENDYKIVNSLSLDTPLGLLEVLKIEGTSVSRLGTSRLLSYFVTVQNQI